MHRYLAKLILLFFCFSVEAAPLPTPSPRQMQTLYNSLDERSLPQLLAFYQLYPDTEEGKKCLESSWKLLLGSETSEAALEPLPEFSHCQIGAITALINKPSGEEIPELRPEELDLIDRIAERLPNRRLAGYAVTSEEDVLKLPAESIDIAKAMLLAQYGSSKEKERLRRSYEASIDLMALQILTKLDVGADPEEKITAINRFIFDEMLFRFPPHSLYAKDIDEYTFLSSVLDSRRGVCLGVSMLYLCLAQRLDLPLEIITPPGHIYVRYRDDTQTINIETTARGINLPSEVYLGIDTRSLQKRNATEAIGLSFVNQASVFWQEGHHDKALETYLRAQPYLKDDMLLKEFIAYQELFLGMSEEGKKHLSEVRHHLPEEAVSPNTMADDYLLGHADLEAMQAVFQHVDETQESILKKRETLELAVTRCPKFRAGRFQLAVTYLQIHRTKEALQHLEILHEQDPNDATVEYYLSMIYSERHYFPKAWEHYHNTVKLTDARDHHPKALEYFKRGLSGLFMPQKESRSR
jgi:tetratricopeptide (TPR) repeat protein